MYRAIPEVNRICCQAARDRAYQQHIQALRNMKSSVDTRKPKTPQTIGRNYKKYENDKIRCTTILRDNTRLENKMREIQKQEHFPRTIPQRPFTLQGQYQKDEMNRIDKENAKLLKAIETRKPVLNRTEWTRHRLDHTYQITKMSEFKKTVPMSDIVRQEYRMSMSRPATTLSHPRKTVSSSYSSGHRTQSQNSNKSSGRYHEEEEQVSLKGQITDTIHDDLEERQNSDQHDSNSENDISLKGQITDTIHDDLQDRKQENENPENKEIEQDDKDQSLKGLITDTVKDDVQERKEEKENGEEDKKEETGLSIKGQISDTIKDDVQERKEEKENPEEDKKESPKGGFSLKGQIEDTIKDDVQERKEEKENAEEYKKESPKGGFSLKGQIAGTIKDDIQEQKEKKK